LLDFIQLPLSYIRKALFKALIGACKRFGIKDHILSITTNNYVINNSVVDQFEKYAVKSVEKDYNYKVLLTIFKVSDSHICYIAHLINSLAQAILTSFKSTVKKHTTVLYNNTEFTSRASYPLLWVKLVILLLNIVIQTL
jgi:hypothetical protein